VALRYATTAANNTIIGTFSGSYYGTVGTSQLTTINNSTLLGYYSRPLNNSSTNEIVIGYNAVGNGDNSTTIGNSNTTSTNLFGSLGFGTTPNYGTTGQVLTSSGSGVAPTWTTPSTGTVTGSGTLNYIPKWTPTGTALGDSQIFDNGANVGIGTITPAYKLDVTGTGRFTNTLYADTNLYINNYFEIDTTSGTIPSGFVGIWRKKQNGFGTHFIEDEQGGAKDKWAFVSRYGKDQSRQWYQTNSSIVDINYGWGNHNSSNYEAATLLLDQTINITDSAFTGTIVRGIYYKPTLTSLTNTTHIAWENTSGDIIHGNLATGGADEMVTVDTNGKLKKAPVPGGGDVVGPSSATDNAIVRFDATTGKLIQNSGAILDDDNNITANSLITGFLNTAASGTQIVLTKASVPDYVITGSGGQTFKLPNATTLAKGTSFSFNNNQSSGAITVNNNSNTLIVSIPSGAYTTVILLDNATAAGSWDYHDQAPSNVSWSTNTFNYGGSITSAQWNGTTVAYNRGGTGQSSPFVQGGIMYGSSTSALASTAAGTLGQVLISNGTSAPTWGTVTGFTRVVSSVSSATAAGSSANTDYVYLVSGTTTITLPTAVGNTNRYTIKNSGTGVVSIATTSSQTIDGSSSPITINVRYVSIDLISDGANWNII
jgi:hypothetical protein